MAMTRGRDDNTVLVITDTHDPAEARDILDGILHLDRADTPAVTRRRELHQTDRPTPACRRSGIPDWFDHERNTLIDQWRAANDHVEAADAERQRLTDRLHDLDNQIARIDAQTRPVDTAREIARNRLDCANHDRYVATQNLDRSGLLHRRAARHELDTVDQRIEQLQARLDQIDELARPADRQRETLRNDIHRTSDEIRTHHRLSSADTHQQRRDVAGQRIVALDGWRDWSDGKAITHDRRNHTIDTLADTRYSRLAETIEHWADTNHIQLRPPTPTPTLEQVIDLDLDLGL